MGDPRAGAPLALSGWHWVRPSPLVDLVGFRLVARDNPPLHMGDGSETIRVADFFCGCGGTSVGLRAAGMDVVFGLDCDGPAAATFRRNFPRAAFLEVDVRDCRPEEIASQVGRGDGHLLVSACAPCQPYSSFVRRTRGRSHDRSLLLRLIPILDLLRPAFVLVENVPGLDTKAPAGTLSRFCKALTRLGYSISWKVVDCQSYGVPQRRRRLVLMGSLLGQVEIPRPTHGPGLLPVATVLEWIADLPPLQAGETHTEVPNHVASALTDINLRRLRASKPGGDRFDWPSELRLACHKEHRGHSDVYGRMSWDAPAPALTTKCTGISNGRFGHPEQDRPISVREAACLQTFPRDFVFEGGIKTATRQVGNAVPPLLAQRMGEAFVRHLIPCTSEAPRRSSAQHVKANETLRDWPQG